MKFELYDLRIHVKKDDTRPMVCNHKEGSSFLVRGENIIFDKIESFPLYCLAALLPLIPAKQRECDQFDWMSTDHFVQCPDPHCGGQFHIERVEKTAFNHSDVTRVPWKS